MPPPIEGPGPSSPQTRARAFRLLFVCLVTTGLGNSMLFAILPPLARELDLSEVSVGVVYMVSGVLFIVMSQVWGRASDRFGRRPFLLIGLVGFAVSMSALGLAIGVARAGLIAGWTATAAITAARAIFGAIGSATGASAQAYVADRTSPEARTAAIASLTAAFGVGAALGPVFSAALTPFIGLVGPLYISAALALIAAAAVRWSLPERTPPKERPENGIARTAFWRLPFDRRLRGVFGFAVLIWTVQATSLQGSNFLIMDRLGVDGARATAYAGGALTAGATAMFLAQAVLIPRLKLGARAAMISGAATSAAGAALAAWAGSYLWLVIGVVLMSAGMGLARPGAAAAASLAVGPDEQGAAAGVMMASAGVGFLIAPFSALLVYEHAGPAAAFAGGAAFALLALMLALRAPRAAA